MHEWAKALRAHFGDADGDVPDLRVEPGLVTGGGATLAAPVIPAGVWAEVDVDSSMLAQTLEHTWEEPLVPGEITRVGSAEAVASLGAAFANAVERDATLLLRFRGYGEGDANSNPWRGGELPSLPEHERRPPESVPNRLGRSGIGTGAGDLVEALAGVYRAF
ncbi:MAG TPA: hypothetical protein VI408_08595 [Gaiellaceae bacterium]